MNNPNLQITMNIDVYYEIEYGGGPIVASKKKYKLDYPEYSEFRDYIFSLLNDTSKYKLLGFKPSDKDLGDRPKLKSILPSPKDIQDPYDEDYRNKVFNYLLTEPNSQSFYVISDILSDSGKVIDTCSIYVRISNHIDSAKSMSKEAGAGKLEFMKKKYNKTNPNYKLKFVSLTVSYSLSYDGSKKYNLELLQSNDSKYNLDSFDDLKNSAKSYLDNVRLECIEEDKRLTSENTDVSVNTDIESSIRISKSYNSHNTLIEMLHDIESYISEWQSELVKDGDDTFDGYVWKCVSIDSDGKVVTGVEIEDNYGESRVIECDIDVNEYFSNPCYRKDELHELILVLFESYDF